MTKFIKPGIASRCLTVPYFGRVRVIFSRGVNKTFHDDGLKEFNIERVLSDPNLEEIKKAL